MKLRTHLNFFGEGQPAINFALEDKRIRLPTGNPGNGFIGSSEVIDLPWIAWQEGSCQIWKIVFSPTTCANVSSRSCHAIDDAAKRRWKYIFFLSHTPYDEKQRGNPWTCAQKIGGDIARRPGSRIKLAVSLLHSSATNANPKLHERIYLAK